MIFSCFMSIANIDKFQFAKICYIRTNGKNCKFSALEISTFSNFLIPEFEFLWSINHKHFSDVHVLKSQIFDEDRTLTVIIKVFKIGF